MDMHSANHFVIDIPGLSMLVLLGIFVKSPKTIRVVILQIISLSAV